MPVNVQVSPNYQGVVEPAGSPQHSTVNDLYENYASVSAIPTGFVGTARVGADLYVGNGKKLTKKQQNCETKKILFYGDSITERNLYSRSTGIWWSSLQGYGVWSEILSSGKIEAVGYIGYGGYTPSQLQALIASMVAPVVTDYVFVLAGANDASTSYSTRLANLEALWTTIENAGHNLIIGTITPHSGQSVAWNATSIAINEYILKQQDLGRWLVADFGRAVRTADGTSWRTGSSADNIHPNTIGAYYMGKAIIDEVLPKLNLRDFRIDKNGYYNPNIRTINPNFIGNNAAGANGFTKDVGITGTGPSYWKLTALNNAIATTSVSANSDITYDSNQINLSISSPTVTGSNNDRVGIFQETYNLYTRDSSNNGQASFFGEYRYATTNTTYVYRNITIGTSNFGASPPIFPTTIGETVTDGTCVWQCCPKITDGTIVQIVSTFKITAMTGTWSFSQEFNCDNSANGHTTRNSVLVGGVEYPATDYTVVSPISAGEPISSNLVGTEITVKSQKIVCRFGTGTDISWIRQFLYFTAGSAGATMTLQIKNSELRVL